MSRLSQARYQKEEIGDNIRLEVKLAYLKNKESEKNIITIKKAIEQAKENFRINEERYMTLKFQRLFSTVQWARKLWND